MKIKDRFLKDPDALLNMASIYVTKGDHQQAREFFEKAIEVSKTPEVFLSYGSYLLGFIMKDRIWRFGLTSKEIDEIKEAERLFGEAINLLKNTEKKAELEDSYINRSTARSILDKFELAFEDVNSALTINPKNPNAYANRARLRTLIKDLDNAIADFKFAIESGANKDDLFPLLVTCYLERPDAKANEAIEIIKKYYSNEDLENNIVPSILLVECLIKKKEYSEAKKVLERLYLKFGRQPRILLTEADLKRVEGDLSSFESLTEEANQKSSGAERNIAKIQLAKHYKNVEAYEKAIPLYESFVSETLFDDILKDYLVCLYKSKENRSQNIQKCLTICDNLRKNKTDAPFVLELEASIYEELDRLEDATGLYLDLSKIEPDKARHKLNYAKTLIDIGKGRENEGANLLIEVKDAVSDRDSFIILSESFLKIYNFDEAIKQAFKALEIDPNNPKIQLLYVYVFINRKDKKSLMLDSDIVKEDFYVKLKKNNQDQEYLMTNNPKASITKFELCKDVGLGKAIDSKRIGDNIKIKNDYGLEESIEILEIKSKYVKAFQNILDNFNIYFPDNKAIFKIEADPSKINEMLKKTSERSSMIMNMYLSRNITIGALSAFSGKSLFTVWGALIGQNNKIYCASGSSIEQKQESEIILKSQRIMIEPISLFTLAYLDILELPSKYFQEVVVAQASLDEINMEIMELSKSAEEGFTTLFYYQDKPYRQEISPEAIKKKIDFLKKIVDCTHIKVVGLNKPLDNNLQEKEKLLGRPYSYSIQNCLEKSLVLFSDDRLFRELINNEYKIESFSMQNFLIQALEKKLISENEYFIKIIELAKLGYHYLSISAKMLFYCAGKTSFQIAGSEDFNTLTKILNSKETSLDSLIMVLTDFMKLIYIESLPQKIKDDYLDVSLQTLASRANPKGISKIFSRVLSKKLGILLSFMMPKINSRINNWLKINHPVF